MSDKLQFETKDFPRRESKTSIAMAIEEEKLTINNLTRGKKIRIYDATDLRKISD